MRRRILQAAAGVVGIGVLAVIGFQLAAGGTGPVTKDEIGDSVQTVPRGRLPVFGEQGELRALYHFATTRGEILKWMPCTCGCAQLGHTSNRSCYIKAETEASVTYTSHAAT